ncbi:hypothetical protein A1O7_02184, partial [Cladophialophora yegresii CBS 114405]
EIVNASGHVDQLHRQCDLLSICGLALTTDIAWVVRPRHVACHLSLQRWRPWSSFRRPGWPRLTTAPINASIADFASAVPSPRRRVSLGVHLCGAERGPPTRILCRLVELLWMAL